MWLHTCFQGHTVAGQALSRLSFGHSTDREHGTTGQAPDHAGLPCAATLEQPLLPLGSHRVSGTFVSRSPVHINRGECIL